MTPFDANAEAAIRRIVRDELRALVEAGRSRSEEEAEQNEEMAEAVYGPHGQG